MNLVRVHYADGTVDSVSRENKRGVVAAQFPGRNSRLVAVTDTAGEALSSIAEDFRSVTRWSQGRLNAERLARNIARVREEERKAILGYQPESLVAASHFSDEELEVPADEEPFEHKPDLAWRLVAVVAVLILAAMIGSAVGSVGS